MRSFPTHSPARPGLRLFCALLLFMTLLPARAESLMERRGAILKGTNQGVVIIESPAPSESSDVDANGEKLTGLRAIFNKLPPPSGCPMDRARAASCPDQGVTIPTGEPTSSNTPNFSR